MRNVLLASNEASKHKQPFKKVVRVNMSSSSQTPFQKQLRKEKASARSSKEKKMISFVLIEVSQGNS